MNGLTIFSHSFRQVTGNLSTAIRVSGGFWVLMIAIAFVVGFVIALTKSTFLGFVLGIAALVFLVWGVSLVAVVWHRYVLLEEQPSGFLPSKPGLRIWPYFWYGVGIVIITFIVLAVLFFIATIFIEPDTIYRAFNQQTLSLTPSDIALRFIVGLLSSLIYLRLALILPAVALDESLTLGDSWSETKHFNGAILTIAVLLSLLNGGMTMVFGMVMFSVQGSSALILIISLLNLVYQWFYFMLNISILSTLYGHIVQKREVY